MEDTGGEGGRVRGVKQRARRARASGRIFPAPWERTVALFPRKELEAVHHLQRHVDKQRAGERARLEGVRRKGEGQQRPQHKPMPAVGKLLNVPPKEARVQLRAPKKVNHDVAAAAAVPRGGAREALYQQHQAQRKRRERQRAQQGQVVVVKHRGRKLQRGGQRFTHRAPRGQPEKGGHREQEGHHAIVPVPRHVARGGHGPRKAGPGYQTHQR